MNGIVESKIIYNTSIDMRHEHMEWFPIPVRACETALAYADHISCANRPFVWEYSNSPAGMGRRLPYVAPIIAERLLFFTTNEEVSQMGINFHIHGRGMPGISYCRMHCENGLLIIDRQFRVDCYIHREPWTLSCHQNSARGVRYALVGGNNRSDLVVRAAQGNPLQDGGTNGEKANDNEQPSRPHQTPRYRYEWGFVGSVIIGLGAALLRLAMELFYKADKAQRFSAAAWGTFAIGGILVVHGLIYVCAGPVALRDLYIREVGGAGYIIPDDQHGKGSGNYILPIIGRVG
jgi:hypothetical protein